jgi:DNA-binding response OmpR family regulator
VDKPKKIVIIEDQDDLKQLGQVVAAPDMNSAGALVASELPDLVVLDVWLGNDLSGLDICRGLKAAAPTSAVKVLMLSACGQQSDVEAGMAAGADRYVIKPFSPDLLVRTARELLYG